MLHTSFLKFLIFPNLNFTVDQLVPVPGICDHFDVKEKFRNGNENARVVLDKNFCFQYFGIKQMLLQPAK